ncbi:MAG: hypothetical protein K2Y16_01100 [Burkholderiales bacterium]|nr:hypothetical protein [Burkholderiales bacterium]
MSLLIHATITVSGDESLLAACDARIRLLLAEQRIEGEIGEHHGAGALCYDLKVKGGIPFPAFVEASQEFPALKMVAEWVNVDAGARGAATIIGGRLTAHNVDKLATAARSARPIHVAVAGDGRLELALTFFRSNRDEWLGYALTAERDALLRVVRVPESDVVELFATEGGAEWSLHWRSSLAQSECDFETMAVPQPIDKTVYRELEQMAQGFVAEWIWFMAGPREEIAIEMERFARYGYTVADANVRSARLHTMQQESSQPEDGLEFSTLGPDETWVKDIVVRCWLRGLPEKT